MSHDKAVLVLRVPPGWAGWAEVFIGPRGKACGVERKVAQEAPKVSRGHLQARLDESVLEAALDKAHDGDAPGKGMVQMQREPIGRLRAGARRIAGNDASILSRTRRTERERQEQRPHRPRACAKAPRQRLTKPAIGADLAPMRNASPPSRPTIAAGTPAASAAATRASASPVARRKRA